jgi:hypothetical protein
VGGLYLLAALLVVIGVADVLSTVWPLRIGDVVWRYGAAGLLAGYLTGPLLGVALAMTLATWLQHRRVLIALSGMEIVVAVLLVAVMGLFALDVTQVRAMRPEVSQRAVLVGGLLQEIKYVLAILALLAMGLGGLRLSKRTEPGKQRGKVGILSSSTTSEERG